MEKKTIPFNELTFKEQLRMVQANPPNLMSAALLMASEKVLGTPYLRWKQTQPAEWVAKFESELSRLGLGLPTAVRDYVEEVSPVKVHNL